MKEIYAAVACVSVCEHSESEGLIHVNFNCFINEGETEMAVQF